MYSLSFRDSFVSAAVAILAVFAISNPNSTQAEEPAAVQISWTERGSYGGLQFTSIQSPAGFPCVVALTTLQNGGLKVSTDCGLAYADLLFSNAYWVTAKDELTGFVAGGSIGLIKTTDQGLSWFPINGGLPMGRDARSVLIYQGDPDSLVCGLWGDGVYAGGTVQDSLVQWSPINDGLGDRMVRTLERVRGGTFMLAGTESGIYRYSQGRWTLVAGGVVANRFVIDAADSSRIYVAAEDGVYRSVNAGLTFTPSNSGLPMGVPINDISRRTDIASVLYVGTRGSGIYESIDFGVSWRPYGPPVPGENDVRAVLATVETDKNLARVFAGTRIDGLYESDYSTQMIHSSWGRIKADYR